MTAETLDGAGPVEETLADGVPFGRYRYIAEGVAAVYTNLLTLLAADSAAAKALLDGLDGMSWESRSAVLRDSLVRRTIEDGACRIMMGLDTIDPATLDELLTAAWSAASGNRTLLDGGERGALLGADSRFGYVWTGDHGSDLPGRRFTEEVHKRIPRFRIHGATPEQVDVLARSARLAVRVAPDLATSALSHNFMVVLGAFEAVDHRFNSFTVPGLPGVLILSPDLLSSDAGYTVVAEALFHEAFHLKFLDLDYVHPLFRSGFRQETSPRITPVWHENDPGRGDWPIDRVLTSMHVYLALTVFLNRAATEVPDWENAAARAVQCRTRASWLCDTVQQHLGELTDSGRRFVASIRDMLAELGAVR
ncbi:aKG-HExxH-type peptide beta-hydroxylase [Amycolatopsis viridis]|uniref:HEXXH motif domain-containing protein n=1 Tax=Amycolatopsis viridis TaxID=185678 RepID=A0ABX0SRV7_9PSEU|nr:HEXXH motif-containing putative peptide modification protein [Amycolatopsis viridis]NIH79692.1 hypothetical protein [Amycolatopsis viridis]